MRRHEFESVHDQPRLVAIDLLAGLRAIFDPDVARADLGDFGLQRVFARGVKRRLSADTDQVNAMLVEAVLSDLAACWRHRE